MEGVTPPTAPVDKPVNTDAVADDPADDDPVFLTGQ